MPKKKIYKGSVRKVSHFRHDHTTARKYLYGSKGLLKPFGIGEGQKDVSFITDLDLGPGDHVEYTWDRGEPRIVRRLTKKGRR